MKGQNLAIGFTVVIEQTVKISADEADANRRLYQMQKKLIVRGRQMGLRISDQFNFRQCSYLSPAETIKAMLIKITKDSLGLTLQQVDQNIRFQKRNHFYNLTYKQMAISKSIIGFCEDIDDRFSVLQPCSIVAGFLYGVLQSMDFYGAVTVERVQNQRQKSQYKVCVKKDIKQQD